MVSRTSYLAFFLLTVSLSSGAAPRKVAELSISEIGTTQADAKEACARFKPTSAQIARFFLRAYPVESHVVTTERYSPCYAKGKIRFSDNNMGDWWLQSGGTATIRWNRGGSVDLLNTQNNGWRDPFKGSYGLCGDDTC